MRDALVGADAFGDVVVGREPAAGGAGLVLDLDQAAVRGLDDGALGSPGIAQNVVAIGRDVPWNDPVSWRCWITSRK
ncbi:hypothetical protein ABIF93_008843 [Bradyrhizobium japonicum]